MVSRVFPPHINKRKELSKARAAKQINQQAGSAIYLFIVRVKVSVLAGESRVAMRMDGDRDQGSLVGHDSSHGEAGYVRGGR